MKYKFGLILLFLVVLSGCSYTTKLGNPIVRNIPEHRFITTIDNVAKNGQASIGDELFSVSIYEIARKEFIAAKPPTGLEAFPIDATWTGTYTYNDGQSGDLIVYTTPDYYSGIMGVALDSKEQPPLKPFAVKVEGSILRQRKRWWFNIDKNSNPEGKFFASTNELIEQWGVRYGGLNDGDYIFEIINKNEAKTMEILQSIRITESSYLEGFVIRGVLIKGVKKDSQGVIQFTQQYIN
jgi:hypothetical protein